MDGAQIAEDPGDFVTGDELDAVAPMRADVRDGSRFTAKLRHQTPIPVGIQVKPILRVRTVGMENLAELAARNHVLGFLDERVVAIVEINRVNEPRFGRQFDQFL